MHKGLGARSLMSSLVLFPRLDGKKVCSLHARADLFLEYI